MLTRTELHEVGKPRLCSGSQRVDYGFRKPHRRLNFWIYVPAAVSLLPPCSTLYYCFSIPFSWVFKARRCHVKLAVLISLPQFVINSDDFRRFWRVCLFYVIDSALAAIGFRPCLIETRQKEVIAMKGISRTLIVLKKAWQELTFAGILRIPFPRVGRTSSSHRENSTAA
jgi:hypothetical protein